MKTFFETIRGQLALLLAWLLLPSLLSQVALAFLSVLFASLAMWAGFSLAAYLPVIGLQMAALSAVANWLAFFFVAGLAFGRGWLTPRFYYPAAVALVAALILELL